MIEEEVLSESPIVGMVLLDLDSMGCGIGFKRSFGSQSLYPFCRLLEVDIRQPAEMVHKDCSNLVALAKEESFVLPNETSHW